MSAAVQQEMHRGEVRGEALLTEEAVYELAGEEATAEVSDYLKLHFDPLAEHISIIISGTQRISSIIKNLQVFSQQEGDLDIEVNIGQNLLSTINLLKTKHLGLVNFVTDFADEPMLWCQPAQLNQVFIHLIVNACDAILDQYPEHDSKPADQPLALAVKGKVEIVCCVEDNNIVITIKDNGCGMDKQTLQHIFDPFYTTKNIGKGTGLGLSVAYSIIKQHNGEISYSSEVGIGTECRLVLPIKEGKESNIC